MAEKPSGEKTEEATPKRRQDARKKGTVAKSQDVAGALGMLAAALVLPMVVRGIAEGALQGVKVVGQVPRDVSGHSLGTFLGAVAWPMLMASLPLLGILLVVGLMANFGQVGFVLSGEPLNPKLEKINPLAGFKRLFSRRSVVEGLKATAKLLIFSWIVYSAVTTDWSRMIGLIWLEPVEAGAELGKLLHGIWLKIAMVWVVIAAFDYFFQKKDTDKELRMTKDEVRREMKEQEGSPEIKGALMQRRRKLLKGGLAKTLQQADVLVTNPTHFAVALKYERNSMHAPVVLAKGQDFLALKMREIAEAAGVPRVENKALARSLYAQCEAGDFVPRELFGAVAEVLAFVYKTVGARRKAG